ncbi:hypothetical protein AGABI1DRAFT_105979, partial [Agaricus bisporus var. burnettii JB137-S8]
MARVETTHYGLVPAQGPHWTLAQEKSIAQDYPFEAAYDSPEQFITQTYLQFLWLPQSLMPLQLLVPSLRRVSSIPSSSQTPHSLHSLLDPLLQTTRAISNKYHVELVQILQDGGGAGELEETMMWYTLHHERMGDQDVESGNQEPWMNEKWRQNWLERLERREVQVQILLYMTKLSLPGSLPVVNQPKQRKRSGKEAVPPSLSPEERLESLMDKLSMLQLTNHLETNGPKLNHNEKDWAQLFCESTVEPIFKTPLPEMCSLLRSKLFPASPFSDDSDADTATASRSPSPEQDKPQVDQMETSEGTSALLPPNHDSRSLSRARSRSLSMSLAQEKEERERSVGVGPGKKRLLNREVSMSRAFKPRPKTSSKLSEAPQESQARANEDDSEIILVEDTPQKPRVAHNKQIAQFQDAASSSSSNLFGTERTNPRGIFGSQEDETDDDDAWMLDSSPDVLLLRPGRRDRGSDDEYEAVTFHTPSKKPRRRK